VLSQRPGPQWWHIAEDLNVDANIVLCLNGSNGKESS
jgi:hypothetical protein